MIALAPLMARFTAAAEAGDGPGLAACFTEDGVYHDVFYGDFVGRSEIARMLEAVFHRDGEAFRWDMIDPVAAGDRGYVRYLFSYRSKLPGAEGRRAVFEGVAVLRLRDGLIADYDEVANAATGLSLMGFTDARIAKFAAKQAAALLRRPEAARHL